MNCLSREEKVRKITGLEPGPYRVGVTTVQIDDPERRRRGLQTEIWYPAAVNEDGNEQEPNYTKYSDYLGLDTALNPEEAIKIANGSNAIGGYRKGITIEELDDPIRSTWLTDAIRNADVLVMEEEVVVEEKKKEKEQDGTTTTKKKKKKLWPLVLFSHGSGAYRASYSFWTECLASNGYVVAACDHPGSARYTIVDGKVITPTSVSASSYTMYQMQKDRPLDMFQLLNGFETKWNSERFCNTIDTNNVAVTGMSFGGYTVAEMLESVITDNDQRIKAGVLMCPSIGKRRSEGKGKEDIIGRRKNTSIPVMVMIGTEDIVLGTDANEVNRRYVQTHTDGDSYLIEILRGGHVSFTSCEMYDPNYGNGIASNGRKCPSLTKKKKTQEDPHHDDDDGYDYEPLNIVQQHEIINRYGLAFLNKYLKKNDDDDDENNNDGINSCNYLLSNHYPDEIVYRSNISSKK